MKYTTHVIEDIFSFGLEEGEVVVESLLKKNLCSLVHRTLGPGKGVDSCFIASIQC